MTNQDLKNLEVDVEYHFTDGIYHNRLKIDFNRHNERIYIVSPQFGTDKIILAAKAKSKYFCKAWVTIGGISFYEESFDLSEWSVRKTELELEKDQQTIKSL